MPSGWVIWWRHNIIYSLHARQGLLPGDILVPEPYTGLPLACNPHPTEPYLTLPRPTAPHPTPWTTLWIRPSHYLYRDNPPSAWNQRQWATAGSFVYQLTQLAVILMVRRYLSPETEVRAAAGRGALSLLPRPQAVDSMWYPQLGISIHAMQRQSQSSRWPMPFLLEARTGGSLRGLGEYHTIWFGGELRHLALVCQMCTILRPKS